MGVNNLILLDRWQSKTTIQPVSVLINNIFSTTRDPFSFVPPSPIIESGMVGMVYACPAKVKLTVVERYSWTYTTDGMKDAGCCNRFVTRRGIRKSEPKPRSISYADQSHASCVIAPIRCGRMPVGFAILSPRSLGGLVHG